MTYTVKLKGRERRLLINSIAHWVQEKATGKQYTFTKSHISELIELRSKLMKCEIDPLPVDEV